MMIQICHILNLPYVVTHKAVNLDANLIFAADPKKAAVELMQLNPDTKAALVFNTVAEATEYAVKARLANLRIAEDDILCCGFPCEPYSKARRTRFATGSWQSHPDTYVLFDILAYIKERRPKLLVWECSRGFGQASGNEEPPAKHFDMLLDQATDGEMAHKSMYMDHTIWCDNGRDRFNC